MLNAEAPKADPAVAALLQGLAPSATVDSLRDGRRALAAQRHFLARFMRQHLAAR